MRYIGNVPATKGVICEIDEREWTALLEITGLKEGDWLKEELGGGRDGRVQRRELLLLMANAVRQLPDYGTGPASLPVYYTKLVATRMCELAEQRIRGSHGEMCGR